MQMYNAAVEVATKDYDTDQVLEQLAELHPSLSESERGWATARISLPGETLQQATTLACAAAERAFGAPAIAAVVMTEAEFDARQGWETVPELVSVSEAAQMLGVSRQRVLQRIEAKTLPATRVGRDYVIARAAVSTKEYKAERAARAAVAGKRAVPKKRPVAKKGVDMAWYPVDVEVDLTPQVATDEQDIRR